MRFITKFLLIFTIFYSTTHICLAQSRAIKRKLAFHHFDKMNYATALKHFEDLLRKDSTNMLYLEKAAFSAKKLNDPIKTEFWYGRLVALNAGGAEAKINYALALVRNGKYNESLAWFQKFKEEDEHNDSRPNRFIEAYADMEQFYEDSSLYAVEPCSFNSSYADFSPVYYKNGLVFNSNRGEQYFIKRVFNWNQQPFLNLFYVDLATNQVKKFSKGVNSNLHEGSSTFIGNDTILITRNNFHGSKVRMNKKGYNNLQMYYSALNNDSVWNEIGYFQHNNEDWSSGHPTYCAKTKELFFVSDRSDHVGGTDIYKTQLTPKGTWTYPVNVGKHINTEGNEMFPFVDSEGNLYFASDGHAGLGGLDIYFAERQGDTLAAPVNLGAPINSSADDFAFITDATSFYGYFSSNRPGGKGDDDIYQFKRKPKPPVYVQVIAKDSVTKMLIDSLTISFRDSCKLVKQTILAASVKEAVLPLNSRCNYEIVISKNGYYPVKTNIPKSSLRKLKDTLKLEIFMGQEIKCLTMTGIVKDETSGKPVPLAQIFIKIKGKNEISYYKSDIDGKFNYCMTPGKEYTFKILKPKYFSGCYTMQIEKAIKGNYVPEKPLTIKPFKLNMTFKVENLLYDKNKFEMKEESKPELDKVLTFLHENESIKIELGSHTDSRGSDVENLVLSLKRAQSAVDYLVSKGIDRNRVIAKGYGETKPLNKCKNGVKCSEEEYAVNRRTEIKVIGFVQVPEHTSQEYEHDLFNESKDNENCVKVKAIINK
jgi:outer membrane protein OmpA-like peptidoglycan-associated protein/tetratricopeptide (TPR) repeat protein